MKSLLIPFSFFFVSLTAQNLQHYRFEQSTQPYQELAGATLVVPMDFVNDKLTNINLDGETFNFFDLDYTFGGLRTMAIQTFGNMRIDNDSSAVIIDGIFTKLDSIDSNTSISYVVEGTSGNLIVKTQWKNIRLVDGQSGNFVNFQIWIYQATGIFEIHYGNRSANNGSGFNNSNGPYAGAFYSNDTFTKMYQKIWLYGSPSNVMIDSSNSWIFSRLLGIPENGTVWSFIPKDFALGLPQQSIQSERMIYPNPCNNEIYLDVKNFSYEIHSLHGQLLEIGTSDNGQIPTHFLAKGSYILYVKDDNQLQHYHFIKE